MRDEMNTDQDMDDKQEQQIGTLIQRAGPRPQPSAAARDAVRRAAQAEWQAVVVGRAARRRRVAGWALAAGLAVAGIAVWVAAPVMRETPPAIATVVRLDGAAAASGSGSAQPWVPVASGTALPAGSELRTEPGGRAALRVGPNVSVRLDENSLVALLAPDRIALKQGALYVDAGERPDESAPLLIETAYGNVRHLGTQYEARLAGDGFRLRVREGRVALTGGGRTHEGMAGEQLTISADGEAERSSIGRGDASWAWASDIAPAYDIENRPLADFLRWVGRETGRDIVYGSSGTEEEARAIVLRGSVAGLTPERALAAVLSTTQLAFRETPENFLIDFRTGDR